MPVIKFTDNVPTRMIPFSKAMSTKDFDQWVHFYEYDYKFAAIWNNPRKYLSKLKKFRGVITPDFSLYRDMPLVMQKWNTYKSRALGYWWQTKNINVIPNVRYADERSYSFCCSGIPKHSVISVGSYGCLRDRITRRFFRQGLEFVVQKLKPSRIVVYGGIPEDVFFCCYASGTKIVHFPGGFYANKKKKSA